MHLVVSTHPSLFWVVYHPSRTFPLKEFKREPQNRLSPSPHRQTIPSLTSDPWLTTPILAGYKLVVPMPCACSTFVYVQSLSVAHSWPLMLWTGFWTFILYGLLPSRARRCLIVGFSLFNPLFAPSVDLLAFLPRHSIIPVVISFGLCLLALSGLLYAFLLLSY